MLEAFEGSRLMPRIFQPASLRKASATEAPWGSLVCVKRLVGARNDGTNLVAGDTDNSDKLAGHCELFEMLFVGNRSDVLRLMSKVCVRRIW